MGCRPTGARLTSAQALRSTWVAAADRVRRFHFPNYSVLLSRARSPVRSGMSNDSRSSLRAILWGITHSTTGETQGSLPLPPNTRSCSRLSRYHPPALGARAVSSVSRKRTPARAERVQRRRGEDPSVHADGGGLHADEVKSVLSPPAHPPAGPWLSRPSDGPWPCR